MDNAGTHRLSGRCRTSKCQTDQDPAEGQEGAGGAEEEEQPRLKRVPLPLLPLQRGLQSKPVPRWLLQWVLAAAAEEEDRRDRGDRKDLPVEGSCDDDKKEPKIEANTCVSADPRHIRRDTG